MYRELEDRIAFLESQVALLSQSNAQVKAREEVNDSMLSALILTHPDRDALREAWRRRSAVILPDLLVRGTSAWDKEFSETAKLRVEHLNDLTD